MVDQSQKISNSSPKSRHSERSEESDFSPRQVPDPEQLRRLLTSPEGQALIRLLQADGGAGLKKAASALKVGNTEEAKEALESSLRGNQSP